MDVDPETPVAVPPSAPRWRKRWRTHWRGLALVAALVIAVWSIAASLIGVYQFWDVGTNSWFDRLMGGGDSRRAAAVIAADRFGDQLRDVVYLSQNWNPADSIWFYNTTQGSDLLPYDFFMVLERPGSTELVRSNENMDSYRYLPQNKTISNPDGLAVGFVKDTYAGTEYVGLTCAACHTGQLNYNGIGYRIDGGPSGADMKLFIEDLGAALRATEDDPGVQERFVKAVAARGQYANEDAIRADLTRYRQRISRYAEINGSSTAYGYFRLDAFGRIYNRVLEHVMNAPALLSVLNQMVIDGRITAAQRQAICQCSGNDAPPEVYSDEDRDAVYDRVEKTLAVPQWKMLRDRVYNRANAPVSYPFLWDIPQHDYVQWNGLAANAGLGPVGRNTGEAIGVFGTLDWSSKFGWSLSSLISGQGFKGTHISFKSSVNVRNLGRIETHLTTLESPQWPKEFPPIDTARADRGRVVFASYCVGCHSEINRADPERRVVAHLSRLSEIGTDPRMASNGVNYSGLSGILRNQYVNAGVGDILIDQGAPVAALLTKATLSVIATPDPDKNLLWRGFEWGYDLLASLFSNDIKASLKHGNY